MQSNATRSDASLAAPSISQRVRVLIVVGATVVLAAFALHIQSARAQSTIPGTAKYSCDFENFYCDFWEQSKLGDAPPSARRSSIVPISRSGGSAVRLHTEPGDSNVHGSGTWERNDLMKAPDASYCNEGQEEWWAVSVLFPDDYVFPPGPGAGIVMDFHHTGSTGQANYEIQTIPGIGLRARGYAGPIVNGGKYEAIIPDPYGAVANVTRNRWYDFVFHVKWSSGSEGLMEGWLNGVQYHAYTGPTLYSGMSCYLKLANYHAAFGQPSSIIYDRVVRGTSAADVMLAGGTPPPPPTMYTLATTKVGTGTGTVASPAGIDCGSTCSASLASGSIATLTATPASGSTFAGWSGACSGAALCSVTVNADTSVTAAFNTAPLTGFVAISPAQLDFSAAPSRNGKKKVVSQTVTFTNNTSGNVTFSQASVSSTKYAQQNNCGTVGPGGSCRATISYYPANAGSTSGTFTLGSNAPNAPHVVELTGF